MAVKRSGLAWPGAENMGDPIGESVEMARAAAAPAVLRHLALEIPRDELANPEVLKAVVRNAESGEEGSF
jgi:hypothetical protein